MVASLICQTLNPKTKSNNDEMPCKDIETIYESNNFVDNSDADGESHRETSKILRYTGHQETSILRSVEAKSKPAAKRQLPVLPRDALRLPSGMNHKTDGLNDLFVIAIGGLDSDRQLVHRFVPSTNRWNVLAALPEPRRHHSVTALQHVLYVAGGQNINSLV